MLNSADFTFDKLIRLTVSSLEFPAVNSRQNEAELIVSEAFNIPINELRLLRAKGSFVNDFVADNQLEKKFELLKNLVTKRNEGVPLQHLTQKANFFGLEFEVGQGVFIPRPETELLVETVLRLAASIKSEKIKVLDLCSGSGAIALALYSKLRNSEIFAVEKSSKAFAFLKRNIQKVQAKENSTISPILADATTLTFEDLKISVSEPNSLFDFITCNPPYIPKSQETSLPKDVLSDPYPALFGDLNDGTNGFEIPELIIKNSIKFLKPGGFIIIEHHETQRFIAKDIFENANFINVTSLDDYNNLPRFTFAQKHN